MRIAVCDDDPLELQRVRKTAEQFAAPKPRETEITVDTFASGDALLFGMKKQGGFDLLILDIMMPGMNGIELAKEIRESGDNCRIIFLTSSPEYAVESYNVEAFFYLLKPWTEAKLASLIGRALLDLEENAGGSVIVKSRGKVTRLRHGAIRYIASDNHKVLFYLSDGGVADCSGRLDDFHDALLSDRRFVNCHKSYIVNMDHVMGISGKEFILTENTRIPISRSVYVQVKSIYLDYFFIKGNGRRS